MVGAPGAEAGGAGIDSADWAPAPRPLMAAPLDGYVVPFARPVLVCDVAGALRVWSVWAPAPMYGVTTWPVIAEPPSLPGAVHVRSACASPPVAVPMVGAP